MKRTPESETERDPNWRKPFYHLDHPRPRTRREFLAQGFLAGAATIVSPSLFGLLSRSGGNAYAQATSCQLVGAGAGRIPFICVDLVGGASIAGSNVLVGQAGGHTSLLAIDGYAKLGLPSTMSPGTSLTDVVDLSLGLPFHTDSAFLRGILTKASPTTLANTNGTIFCSRSSNDTQNNPLNPMYGIAKTGSNGGLLTLIGMRSTDSGGNSLAPMSMIDPAIRPTKIDRPSDAVGLVDTGRLVEYLDSDGAEAVMGAVKRLSDRKVDKMELTEEAIVTELVRCSYAQSSALAATYSDPTALDPTLDPLIIDPTNPIFSGTDFSDAKRRGTAAVMKLVVEGHAGAGTLSFGGYDYHDSTRASGETRDFEAGVCLGACLEYAARVGRDLCLYVFSDGSVQSSGELDNSVAGRGKGVWRSDSSSTAAAFMLVYSPAGRPALVDPLQQQIGHFKPDGSVEIGVTEIDNNPAALTEAVVLNYLALHDEKDRFDEVLPDHTIGTASPIEDLIAFDKIRG